MATSESVLKTFRAVLRRMRLLVLIGSLFYVPYIGLRGAPYPDEPGAGEACQEMSLSGGWSLEERVFT